MSIVKYCDAEMYSMLKIQASANVQSLKERKAWTAVGMQTMPAFISKEKCFVHTSKIICLFSVTQRVFFEARQGLVQSPSTQNENDLLEAQKQSEKKSLVEKERSEIEVLEGKVSQIKFRETLSLGEQTQSEDIKKSNQLSSRADSFTFQETEWSLRDLWEKATSYFSSRSQGTYKQRRIKQHKKYSTNLSSLQLCEERQVS